MLETAEIERIRGNWAQVAADPGRMGQAFYANLFRIDPSTKPLFVGDIDKQGRKLAQTLTFIVDHVDDPDILLPAARDLALRHLSYNVVEAQYASVGLPSSPRFARFWALASAPPTKPPGLPPMASSRA